MMICFQCGGLVLHSADHDIAYRDGDNVIFFTATTLLCLLCGFSEVTQTNTIVTPIPDRTDRYFIDFECDKWMVIDSFEDIAIDDFNELAEALILRDELNLENPYRFLEYSE
jgi:hypothetical protein